MPLPTLSIDSIMLVTIETKMRQIFHLVTKVYLIH